MNLWVVPHQSRKFVRVLLVVSLLWFALGIFLNRGNSEDILAFIQIFLFTFLDLIFLLLLFWTLFFTPKEELKRREKKFQIFSFGFFKLVCLGFLAITLKRLGNASVSAVVMGVGIIWLGPLISGIFLKIFLNKNN